MTYKVTITWSPTTAQSAIEQLAETIGGRFDLEKSYVQTEMFKDTPYYSEAPDGTLGDTPVNDNENTMHKGVLLAFKQAIENDEHSIVLTGIKRLTALYFEELSYVMGEQGFIITVEEGEGEHPVETDEISFDILDSYKDYPEWFEISFGIETPYHMVKISEDYLPISGSYTLKCNFEDASGASESTYSDSLEVSPMNDEHTLFQYDGGDGVIPMFMVTVPEGASWEEDGGSITFPSGGSWTYFEVCSELAGVSKITYKKLEQVLKNIYVKTAPKSGYFVGETLDLSGLEVEATYSYMDGEVEKTLTKEISTDDCTISPQSGYVFSSGGIVDVSIAYEDKTTVCQVGAVEVDTGLSFTWDGVPDEFILSMEEPEDWETAWPMYYELDGQGGYKLADPSTWTQGTGQYPEWKSGTYYLPKYCTATQYKASGQQDYAERYCLVLDGVVPDPARQVSSAVITYNAGGVSSNYNAYLPASYSGDGFVYATSSIGAIVCVKAPSREIVANCVFDKIGTYFVQRRYNNTGVMDYPQELKFTI